MKNQKFNKALASPYGPFIAMALNILMAFVIYAIARLEFFFENFGYFSNYISLSLIGKWMEGGYMFDRSAIAYTNALYIVLMLFPLWIKERRYYHLLCKWVFVVVNGLMFIINLCDSVYFPYTLRRTTTSVFHEFQNENNLGDVFWGEFLQHWYLVILAVMVIWAMWKLFVMPQTQHTQYSTIKSKLRFGVVQLEFLLLTTPLVIVACRGGWSGDIRPITVNNANEYVQRPTECA